MSSENSHLVSYHAFAKKYVFNETCEPKIGLTGWIFVSLDEFFCGRTNHYQCAGKCSSIKIGKAGNQLKPK